VQTPIGALHVIACPGHTPGHSAYYREQEGLLFSGDAVMNIVPNLVPAWRRPDLSLPVRLFTTDWQQARQSARRLAKLRPAALLAGHGRPLMEGTADCLEAWTGTLR
jgi:glyoxylase-like metal-dependent hydrolase (beta-lactamase superfamily II)